MDGQNSEFISLTVATPRSRNAYLVMYLDFLIVFFNLLPVFVFVL